MRVKILVGLLCMCVSTPAMALNIVVSNDDGLTSNVKALYEELKAKGHDVIVSVPCNNQSGMGGAVLIQDRVEPLKTNCRNNAARAGAAGTGPMEAPVPSRDFYYVNGTPVMATMYGIDILAQKRWGRTPDLVLSGPNEGQNVGPLINGSGTVSNAQFAAFRGVPAIAISGGVDTAGDDTLDNPKSKQIADLCLVLLDRLQHRSGGGRLLPPGTALNVNFPDDLTRARWQVARIGSYSGYSASFVEKADGREAEESSRTTGSDPAVARIIFSRNNAPPSNDQALDEAVVFKTAISVSIMRVGFEGDASSKNWLSGVMGGL